MMPCRHRGIWVIGQHVWCWRCGALREIEWIGGNSFRVVPGSRWVKPAGSNGDNPALKEKL